MKFRFKDFYLIGLLTTSLLFISFHRFIKSAVNTISLCKISSAVDSKGQKCISPYDEVDQELASYPWIGDPSCQHFSVQVKKIVMQFESKEISLTSSNSSRKIKHGPSGL
jgi:hypothetical protein